MADWPVKRYLCGYEPWCAWPVVKKSQLRIIEVRNDGVEVLDQVTYDHKIVQGKKWRRYCYIHYACACEILEQDMKQDQWEHEQIIAYLDKVTIL